MSLNPFPLTDLRPEIELMHILLSCLKQTALDRLRVCLNFILYL